MTISMAFKLISLAKHPYNYWAGKPEDKTFLEKIQKIFEETIDEDVAWRRARYENDKGFISKKHIDRVCDIGCFCCSLYSIKILFDVSMHILKSSLLKCVVCSSCFLGGIGVGALIFRENKRNRW